MGLGKSTPRSTSSTMTGASLDIRSPVPSLPKPTVQRHVPSRCSLYAAIPGTGTEPWIARQDIENQNPNPNPKLLNEGSDLARNGDVYDRRFKTLPKGCKLGKMVGEGAANAVFEFQLPDGSHFYHQNTRLLLRVAKEFVEDDRPRFDYIEQDHYYNSRIKPILGPHVLHQELVVIRNSGIIDAVNNELKRNNDKRKEKFKGSWVAQSDWGFLIEDMRPDDPNDLLVEFKPKWLSQSPSAPQNAIRCRQCAKELHNYVMEPDEDKPIPTMAKPCPLTLGRRSSNRVRSESAYRLLPELESFDNPEHLNMTLNALRDEAAFKRLRYAQENHDTIGPLSADKCDNNFSLAMTLRDCTCFAQVTRRASSSKEALGPLKVRFGDFDMKSPRFRLDYWRGLEQELIDGGFYTAEWIWCDGTYYKPPTSCVLGLFHEEWEGRPEVIRILEVDSKEPPHIDTAASRLNKEPIIRCVRTEAGRLRSCLEAHKKEAPGPTPEEEQRLKITVNGSVSYPV